jgi:hypothetical protein
MKLKHGEENSPGGEFDAIERVKDWFCKMADDQKKVAHTYP